MQKDVVVIFFIKWIQILKRVAFFVQSRAHSQKSAKFVGIYNFKSIFNLLAMIAHHHKRIHTNIDTGNL